MLSLLPASASGDSGAAAGSLLPGSDDGDDEGVQAFALALLLLTAVDGEPGPSGGSLGLAAGGGVVGGDVVAGVDILAGVDTAPFSLVLRAPVNVRVVDRAPLVGTSEPSVCRVLRCDELLRGQRLDPTALARLVDEFRLFRATDVFSARLGRLSVTLGEGAVVDRFTSVASWDRRTSGARLALRSPHREVQFDLVVGDVVSPGELLAARVDWAPVATFAGSQPGPASAMHLTLDSAVDALAPAIGVDRTGSLLDDATTQPLTLTVAAARLRLGGNDAFLTPRVETGLATGFSATGLVDGRPGVGIGAGADAGLRTMAIDLRARATVAMGTAGYRRAPFSTFYLVERREALLGSAQVADESGRSGLARVAAPGGVFFDARLEASLVDAVAPLVRVHFGPSPGENVVEVGMIVDEGPVRFSLLVQRRGVVRGTDLLSADLAAFPVLGALEAAVRVTGPFSVGVRWLRLPRLVSDGPLRIDDDVWAFVSVDGMVRAFD